MEDRFALNRQNVIARTLYGSDIYAHILRLHYPGDFLMKVSGDECGWNRNPWDNSRPTLHIWIERLAPAAKLPPRLARHHDTSGHIPDGDALDFAARYWQKTGDELLQVINDQLHLGLGRERRTGILFPAAEAPEPKFSFFKAPISTVIPYKQITVPDAYRYITGRYAREQTLALRRMADPHQQRMYKAAKFDYCTFSGTFSVRNEKHLLGHSGLLCLDFDHLGDVEGLFRRLQTDEYFETRLLFRSPRGEGLKWVIAVELDGKPHKDYFRSVSQYVRQTYGVPVDESGKDVCRACFLPHDPAAYIHPRYRL